MFKILKQDSQDYWNSCKDQVFSKKGIYDLISVFGLFAPIVWVLFAAFAFPGYVLWMLLMASLTLQDEANRKLREIENNECQENRR